MLLAKRNAPRNYLPTTGDRLGGTNLSQTPEEIFPAIARQLTEFFGTRIIGDEHR